MPNIVPVNNVMALLENGCRAISQARTVQEAVGIRDAAEELRHHFKARGYGVQAMNDAAEIKLRAERRLGELLHEMPKQRPGEYQRLHRATVAPSLDDLGIEKTQSHRWQKIADIDEEVFEDHIATVRDKEEELTTAGMLRCARKADQPGRQNGESMPNGCVAEDLYELVRMGKRYGTIYVDPPWKYSNQGTRAATDNHYKTLTVDEIADPERHPVRQLAADCCHLHLWTTNAFLYSCPAIFESWGFKYQGLFVWCKPQMGIGNCWRVSHELLLLAIRGEPRRFLNHSLMSWAALDRGQHSAKPDKVREMIELASPGPRLELFGRRVTPGWTVWGDQVERDIFYQSAERM